MKKNISINISGIIFHIEEDGYERLREYLDSINKYFASFEDSSEIIADIESRIAEIFLSKLKEGDRQVVTSEDVEALVATMGTVADFQSVEEEPQTPPKEEPTVDEKTTEGEPSKPTKLYRDLKRKVAGGVASGIAYYFGIDPLWIRLIWIILFFNIFLGFGLSGLALLGYIIMWIVVPGSDTLEEDKKIKKMYRNSEDKVLGGVSSGLAAYFGADVVLIRVLFVLSIFLGGSGFIIYIILWIITPEAKSITEKMQMQGEPVTLSNIEHSVKDRMNIKEDPNESAWVKILLLPFRLIAVIFNGLVEILGPAAKFLLEAFRVIFGIVIILISLCLIISLIFATAIFFGLFAGMEGWVSIHDLPFDILQGIIPPFGLISVFICTFIPALAIGILGFSLLFKTRVTNSYVGWALFGIWIIGLIGASLTIPTTIADFRRSGEVSISQDYDLGGKQAVLSLNEIGMDDYKGVRLTLRGQSDSIFTLTRDFEARGRNREQAQENARMAEYNVVFQDSVFTFDSNISFKDEAKFRFQEISMVLYIPYGQVFYLEEDLEYILRNTIHRYGYSLNDIDDNQWMFTEDGLECITCDGRPSSLRRRFNEDRKSDESLRRPRSYGSERLSFDFEDFDEIVASSRFDFEITKGSDFDVQLYGQERFLDRVRLKQYGDQLEFETRDWRWFSLKRTKAIKVEVTMPELKRLKLSDACNAEVAGFSGDLLEIDLSGTADADISAEYDEIYSELRGSSDLNLSGESEELKAELSGTASLNALGFQTRIADVEARGASDAKVNVTSELQVATSGAGSVKYKGDPEIEITDGRSSAVSRY